MASHPVVFIGAGPGEADLITLRGAKRLAAAEVVLFDALADPALREHAPQAEWIDVGKRGFSSPASSQGAAPPCPAGAPTAQERINAAIVEHARRGRRVVRLKGGDPSVFGRLEEELEALAAAGLRAEIVPGVTAAVAAAALTQRPLTRRGGGRSVSLATAMTRTLDLHVIPGASGGAKPSGDTEVYYMAGRQLEAITRHLIDAGWPADAPCCVTSRAGWPDARSSEHRVAGLAEAHALHAGRPTIVVVGAGARAVVAMPAAAFVPNPAP
ncbi:MAG TPA: uroporphyrinogen-III C-methyltransferase [Methylibium sp.]|uniref:uroporphyrinogen-III C-methyltransferase n=1 Tax=Methylibium sp. TaxID=2067992 RepID=UPI002DBA9866|nr:uroporphyrinogen-III C-methyltransferase [Methylibium sp.]HEU4460000.1 uroporphyrinogen-III C-methyltransferase [Methylibium sp.]